MRILSVGDVALKHADYVFRQSPATGRLATIAFLGAAIAMGAAGLLGAVPRAIAVVTGGSLLLFAAIAAITYRRSQGSDNWILAVRGPKLLIKLRSHLNPDTRRDSSSVVELEATDLVGFRVTRSTVTGHDSAGSRARGETMFLDIIVNASTREIERMLTAERSRRADGSVWRHYPVTLPAPDTLRLEWRGTYARIIPEIEEAVRHLAAIAPPLAPASERVDLGTSGRQPENSDVERELRLLAHQGRVVEAIVLAVRSLGMSQAAAREYVEQISSGTTKQRRLRDGRTNDIASLAAAALLIASPAAHAQSSSLLDEASTLERAGFEDYRHGIGRLEGGVLRATLEVRAAAWRPWGEGGPAIRTHVYAPDGDSPRTPGPLIRVKAGTPVHLTFRNALGDMLVMRGLRDRGAIPSDAPPFTALVDDSIAVAPGTSAEVRFTPTEPGTFVYFGRTLAPGESASAPTPFPIRSSDRALWGVLIVDPPGEDTVQPERERIFLITHWAERSLPGSFLPATRFFINGRSWPHTERLEYAQGDTIRWRVINVTGRAHPMHLHGAYFSLDARGDQLREVRFPEAGRRLAVTETLTTAQTMRLSWVAEEPGNWLFHCHFMRHMSWLQASAPDAPPDRHAHGDSEGEALMGGLVMGINVRPGDEYAPPVERARRRLDLHMTRRDAVFDAAPAYGFVLATGKQPPAADSIRFPGSPIVLVRGEPTQIVVHNRADVALGVHWHGMELESWADGVPGWSGIPGRRVVPAIAPGDSLAVRMTPPRSGSFMYHVHSEPGHQLAQGMYGPLLVLEPTQQWDRETDRIFLLGSLGSGEDPPAAINGQREPAPMDLRAGTTYRLRFMHISPDDDKRVSLLRGDQPTRWRFVAKDGADLPESLVRTMPAQLRINVGETYDFMWTPDAGEYTLLVLTTFDQGVAAFRRDAPAPHTAEIRISVR